MDKMQEIMNAIDNFNALVEDVKSATEDNKEIARGNIKSALKFYVDKLQPYLDIAIKLGEDIYCGRVPKPIGENHIRLMSGSGYILIQCNGKMFELKEDYKAWGNLGYKNYDDDTFIPQVLEYLDYIFGSAFNYFENDFYDRVNSILENRMKEADRQYKDSLKFKNLTER